MPVQGAGCARLARCREGAATSRESEGVSNQNTMIIMVYPLAERAFKTGGGGVPLPVLSAGKARRCWCQQVVRAVEVP